ncbi:cadherin domain-containing protein [Vreelandella aquamarina]|uniref:cadherin domain-containing protein n=1 Tax=Vreelandella aquamarina TaxID=77097 RepID=UPI00384DE537
MAQDKNIKMSLQLVERFADHSIQYIPLIDIASVPAQSGAQYAVIDTATGKSPEGLRVKRRGSSLLVETEDDLVLVEIVDFYEEADAVFIPQAELEGTALAGEFVTSSTPAIDTAANGEELIWQGSSGSELLTPTYLGLGGLALGGLAIAASGSSGGGGASSETGETPTMLNTVAGVIVGGPVIEGNDLRVDVYQADGVTKLGEAQVNPDGTFSIAVGSYLGVVIARVVNGGSGADYLDEATQVGKDLNAELFAMEVVTEPNSTVNVNLNVISTLAYHKVQDEASNGAPTSSMVDSINKGIADLFGLPSLHGLAVEPTNGGRFNSDDGLSSEEMYGALLAALSGADAQNGGDSQQTINDLLAGLTISNGTAVLSESAQGVVVQGAEFTSAQTGDALTGTVPGVVDTFSPRFNSGVTARAIDENSAPGQTVYTAAASDAGSVTYRLKSVDDHAAFTINATTGAVTLTGNPDHEAKASYNFTVVATDAAGNASEQAVSLLVNDLDEVAPTITSATKATALNENSGAGQVVYTATSTDSADIATGITSYSLKAGGDAALFSINAATGAVTLTSNPDHEAKASYSFTVVVTDAAGNASEQVVTLGINNLDDTAPSITSAAIATAIDENSGAGQVVYTAASTDDADVVTGATRYSLKTGADAALFSMDANTGVVTLTGNPDHEIKASYNFTVIATDTAGNTSEQSVTLGINNLDDTAPSITSKATATAIDENTRAGQVVYIAASTDDADAVTGSTSYSLKKGGDAALFSINATTGAVTLTDNPDHESQSSYSFTVIATDAAGNASEQAVNLRVNDLDEVAPTITSATKATALNENSGAGQVVYTATSTDSADIATGSTRYSLKTGADAALFSINATTGAVTLTGNPDHESQSSYSFTVVATDAAGNASEQSVTLGINDLDDTAPSITSGATATAIDENSGAGKIVYTAASTDDADVVTGATRYSLKTGADAALFSIDANTGVVTLTDNPNYETKPTYSFTVVATDAAGNASEQAVTLGINNLDDTAPILTSRTTATAIAENSGAGQVVYTVTSSDSADISTGSTRYSLQAGGDAALFTINSTTGEVTLIGNPDFETKASYRFTVVATDAANNGSEQTVTLAINDLVDEVAPTVSSVAITSASGAQNDTLNEGDVVSVTVTMDEDTLVDTTNGTPRVALTIGSSTVYADYVSGSGGSTLVFQYTILADQTDLSGIAIPANALEANGGGVRDTAGNAAVLEHGAVLDNNRYLVDTTAPSISSSASATAVDENSITSQIVYTATATDAGSVTYSLKSVDDHAAFSIDSASGDVTLSGNPDYETKPTYSFTVVATDAAGNTSEQAVTLGVNNLDDTAPTITSAATANSINENSGAGQVVYTVTSTDSADVSTGSTSYSLKADDDASLFSINETTGEVTLIVSPDFETKESYRFTVVATDAAGNFSEQAVTLAVNDIVDETAPVVSSVAITDAIGEQNDTLNVGDVVSVTVTMDEDTLVDTTNGTPRVALTIGSSTVYADYVSGSGSSALVFQYTILADQTDLSGIAIPANALEANGGSLRDTAGNAAALEHMAVLDNASYLVDTTAPIASVVTAMPTTVLEGASNGEEYEPQVTALGSGGAFAVTWYGAGSDGNTKIFVQRFDISGMAQGNPIALEPDGVVNGYDDAVQITALGSDGAFAVTWSGPDAGGDNSIFVQRFDSSGTAQGVPIQLEPVGVTTGTDSTPQIVALGGGGAFAVTWSGSDGSDNSIFVQRFDANGVAVGSPILLEPDGVTAKNDSAPQITAMGSDGAFVVTWQGIEASGDSSIFVQRFDSGGAAQGTPILLEPIGVTNGSDVSAQIVALGSNGAFAVTWSGQDAGGENSIFVQRFDSSGTAQGTPVLLEPDGVTTGYDYKPQITALGSNGAFAVTWSGPDADGDNSIFVQRFDTSGTAQGSPILLEPVGVTNDADSDPQITALGSNGAFVVTWYGNDGNEDSIFVQRFDASGAKQGSAILLEPDGLTEGGDYAPQITALGNDGAFVVTWYGENGSGGFSVFVQRFNADGSTTAPTTFKPGQSVTAQSSEVGTVYLVHSSVTVTDEASITGAANTLWKSVAVSVADSNAALDTTGLAEGTYAVYSVDAAGNLSAAATTTITIDGTAPQFSSADSAPAINENSGAGQTVYTASASDDTAVSYSLKATSDSSAFAINATTGAVTLTGNPDYEAQASYSFTVVATDIAGNFSEQAVTLVINDIVDETIPAVTSVAITSASGAQNNTLNIGDQLNVTVTMSESTIVTGTPRVGLNIGGSTVYADYVSGTGTASLIFQYTIQAGQADANGISIAANALQLNGGTLADAAGNNATLTHAAVLDNTSYLVDTTAPTLSSSTPIDGTTAVAVGNNIVLTFNELVQAGSGNFVISNGTDTRTISVNDNSQVSISGSMVTINPAADLSAGSSYHVQMGSGVLIDQAGNAYAGISDSTTLNFDTAAASTVDTSIVVFDLIEGVNSSHSERTFNDSTDYTIYIRVSSTSGALSMDGNGPGASDSWGSWSGANNLGSNDHIVLVGSGAPVRGAYGGNVNRVLHDGGAEYFATATSSAVVLYGSGQLSRYAPSGGIGNAQLWTVGFWGVNPNIGITLNSIYFNSFAEAGVPNALTTQGLAGPV